MSSDLKDPLKKREREGERETDRQTKTKTKTETGSERHNMTEKGGDAEKEIERKIGEVGAFKQNKP